MRESPSKRSYYDMYIVYVIFRIACRMHIRIVIFLLVELTGFI